MRPLLPRSVLLASSLALNAALFFQPHAISSITRIIPPQVLRQIRQIAQMSSSAIPKTDIHLYTWGTPNGKKISVTLEELAVPYETHPIAIGKNVQKEEWFLKINPNGRIPAIIDKTSGTDLSVFESGAIMLYLTSKYDPEGKLSFPYGTPEYWEMVEWVFFQNAGLGPMQGQLGHFRGAAEKIPYAIKRYTDETMRLFGVLEMRLNEQAKSSSAPWLAGKKMTIADITSFTWVMHGEAIGLDMTQFPKIKDWLERIGARDAVKRGLQIPKL